MTRVGPVRTPRSGHLSQKADCVGKNPIIAISGAVGSTHERYQRREKGTGREERFGERCPKKITQTPSSSEAPVPANTAPLDVRVEITSHNSS